MGRGYESIQRYRANSDPALAATVTSQVVSIPRGDHVDVAKTGRRVHALQPGAHPNQGQVRVARVAWALGLWGLSRCSGANVLSLPPLFLRTIITTTMMTTMTTGATGGFGGAAPGPRQLANPVYLDTRHHTNQRSASRSGDAAGGWRAAGEFCDLIVTLMEILPPSLSLPLSCTHITIARCLFQVFPALESVRGHGSLEHCFDGAEAGKFRLFERLPGRHCSPSTNPLSLYALCSYFNRITSTTTLKSASTTRIFPKLTK